MIKYMHFWKRPGHLPKSTSQVVEKKLFLHIYSQNYTPLHLFVSGFSVLDVMTIGREQ